MFEFGGFEVDRQVTQRIGCGVDGEDRDHVRAMEEGVGEVLDVGSSSSFG